MFQETELSRPKLKTVLYFFKQSFFIFQEGTCKAWKNKKDLL